MWNLRRNQNQDCTLLREALENSSGVSALRPSLQQHLAVCPECRQVAEEFDYGRTLLGAIPSRRHEPSPWFVGRVMSAIAARESEIRNSMETWSLVPRLAAKLAWASALALLLAGTWLYERPKVSPHLNDGTSEESLFEAPSPAAPDDLLASVLEHE